jgi:hypothetical protein
MKVTVEDMGGGHEMLMLDNEQGECWGIPFSAIASWGQLLGITDPAEIVSTIMKYQDDGTEWAGLYETLEENLDELAKAGVPAEYMADLVDPKMPSPIPGPAPQKRLLDQRGNARTRMAKKFRKDVPDVSEFRQSLDAALSSRKDRIAQRTTEFMDQHSPQYLIEVRDALSDSVVPPPAPAPAPAPVEDLQIHLTQISLDTI